VKAAVAQCLSEGLPLSFAAASAVPLDGNVCLTNWGTSPVGREYGGKLVVVEGWPLLRTVVPVVCVCTTAGKLAIAVVSAPGCWPQDTVTRLSDSIYASLRIVLS
jgi:hypothetical protein